MSAEDPIVIVGMARTPMGGLMGELAGLSANELGAEAVLDRSDMDGFTDRVRELTGGAPLDAVMDLVGGDMTDRFIDAMIFDMKARNSYPRLSIAGASGGNLSEIMWTRIYLYQVQVFGVSHGTREEAEQLIGWIRSGELKPVLHAAFKLSDLHRAEDYFVSRGNNFLGKIVIVPDRQLCDLWAVGWVAACGDGVGMQIIC